MKLYLSYDPRSSSYELYARERVPGGPTYAYEPVTDGPLVRRIVQEGESMLPMWRLTREHAEEGFQMLADTLADLGFIAKGQQAQAPVVAHLADAQQVRDRLLSMIEKGR